MIMEAGMKRILIMCSLIFVVLSSGCTPKIHDEGVWVVYNSPVNLEGNYQEQAKLLLSLAEEYSTKKECILRWKNNGFGELTYIPDEDQLMVRLGESNETVANQTLHVYAGHVYSRLQNAAQGKGDYMLEDDIVTKEDTSTFAVSPDYIDNQ